MFRKTKIKLVSLYTIVFFIILSTFGLCMYMYMYRITYLSIDDKLQNKSTEITKNFNKALHEESEHETERPMVNLLWSASGKLLRSNPDNVFVKKDLQILTPKDQSEKLKTVIIAGRTYRVLSIQTEHFQQSGQQVKLIQIVYNISPEVDMLKDMLIMVGVGSVLGLVFSFLVGLFLANKALVPIQRSWEKQTQFVADASHELRTPLAVIQTHLELLFRHPTNTIEEESETIFKSLSEVKRINKLVEELLTLARSDSNEQQIHPDFFKMDDLLQLIVEQFKPIAEMQDIILQETIDHNIIYYGDQERLHQLFVILLDNALKFTSANGTVLISCKKEGNYLKIIVKDTGAGIPEQDLSYIFDRFFRGNKSRSRSEGGTGLGLSIAKWIVEEHHGQIGVESKLNKGTSFLIRLPIKESLY